MESNSLGRPLNESWEEMKARYRRMYPHSEIIEDDDGEALLINGVMGVNRNIEVWWHNNEKKDRDNEV